MVLGRNKWAASWQNQHNGMCAQRRFGSAWAESWLSVWRKLGSFATIEHTSKTLIILGGCPSWSESSLVLSLDGTNMFGWYEEWPYIICSQREPRSNRIFARSSGPSVSAQGVIGICIHVINWRVSMVLIGVHEIYSLFDLSLLWTHMSLCLFSHAVTHKCIVCNSL